MDPSRVRGSVYSRKVSSPTLEYGFGKSYGSARRCANNPDIPGHTATIRIRSPHHTSCEHSEFDHGCEVWSFCRCRTYPWGQPRDDESDLDVYRCMCYLSGS